MIIKRLIVVRCFIKMMITINGLGNNVIIETECEEVIGYIERFYYRDTENMVGKNKVTIRIGRCGKDYFIYLSDQTIPLSAQKIYSYLNYLIIQSLTELEQENSIYFHASALFVENSIYIFFNSSGSGKTTLVANCLKEGKDEVEYLADDVVRIDFSEKRIYGLASGQRIKKGTKELYFSNELLPRFSDRDGDIWVYKPEKKPTGYASIEKATDVFMINVNYLPNSGLVIKKMTSQESLTSILKNTYNIHDNKSNIIKNIASLYAFSFYSLIYDQTENAVKMILENGIAKNGEQSNKGIVESVFG